MIIALNSHLRTNLLDQMPSSSKECFKTHFLCYEYSLLKIELCGFSWYCNLLKLWVYVVVLRCCIGLLDWQMLKLIMVSSQGTFSNSFYFILSLSLQLKLIFLLEEASKHMIAFFKIFTQILEVFMKHNEFYFISISDDLLRQKHTF